MNNTNIMLIGFMGTGKTTISHYLSTMLDMEEFEIDDLIVDKEGMSINEIFKNYGEEYFRDCESEIIMELQKKKNVVISCGGGIVLREKNIVNMKKQGKIVLLTASPKAVYLRVKEDKQRPILADNMNVEYISELMEKRRKQYEHAADITIHTDDKSIAQICEELIEQLNLKS